MFAATDVLNPRRPDYLSPMPFSRQQASMIKSAATLSGVHLDLHEKTRPGEPESLIHFLDRYLSKPPYQEAGPQFEHMPLHDAESVY